ncbi:MAG: hypothetical protein ACOC9T_03480 [Myxococcota bacterium]
MFDFRSWCDDANALQVEQWRGAEVDASAGCELHDREVHPDAEACDRQNFRQCCQKPR